VTDVSLSSLPDVTYASAPDVTYASAPDVIVVSPLPIYSAAPDSTPSTGTGTSSDTTTAYVQSGALITGVKSVRAASGVLALTVSLVNTFELTLDQNVTSVTVDSWPSSNKSERVVLYVTQGPEGPYTITGWPDGTLTASGAPIELTPRVGAVDCIVIDTPDGGDTLFANLIGSDYLPYSET